MTTRRQIALGLTSLVLATCVGTAQGWPWTERIKGDGNITAEVRDPGAFDAVSLAGNFKVEVRQASSNHVEIKTDKNLLPYVETRIVEGSKGRTLEIEIKRGSNLSPSTTMQVTLDMPQLRALSIAGSGDIKVGAMKTANVSTNISGSGNIAFTNLESDSLSVDVSGSGDILASGHTGTLKVAVSGSGDVKTRDLAADDVKISIAGSGDAVVQANKTLHVSIAGAGDVAYVGGAELSSSISGVGKVKKLNN